MRERELNRDLRQRLDQAHEESRALSMQLLPGRRRWWQSDGRWGGCRGAPLRHNAIPARRATRPTSWRFESAPAGLRRVVYSSFGVGLGVGFSGFSAFSSSLSCLASFSLLLPALPSRCFASAACCVVVVVLSVARAGIAIDPIKNRARAEIIFIADLSIRT